MDWNSPKVVGFKDNPKPCGEYVIFKVTWGGSDYQAVLVWDAERNSVKYGPVEVKDAAFDAWYKTVHPAPGFGDLFGSEGYVGREWNDIASSAPYYECPAASDKWGDFTDWWQEDVWPDEDPDQEDQGLINVYRASPDGGGLDLSQPRSHYKMHGSETFGIRVSQTFDGLWHMWEDPDTHASDTREDVTMVTEIHGPFGLMVPPIETFYQYYVYAFQRSENYYNGYFSQQDFIPLIRASGHKSEKTVANMCLFQYRPHNISWKYAASMGGRYDHIDTVAGDVVTGVQAQALNFKDGYANEDLIPYGNNDILCNAIKATLEFYFDLCHLTAGLADVSIFIEIVK